MVKWIQEKPEVIAYLRTRYYANSLPEWMGVIEGDVDYRSFCVARAWMC
jgi:hypothetical protein